MFAELLWVEPEQVVAGGNSSLAMMHEVLADLLAQGRRRLPSALGRTRRRSRFICPVPGYDRHFTLLEWFGIEMVTGADDRRRPRRRRGGRRWSATTRRVKGMWVVPTYANPTGSVVTPGGRRAAGLDADRGAGLQDLLGQRLRVATTCTEDEAKTRRHPVAGRRRPGTRTGRSCSPRRRKITYAGAGVRLPRRLARDRRRGTSATSARASIGPDKVNQLRHAAVLRRRRRACATTWTGTATILAPKFEAVDELLDERLGGLGVADLDPTRRAATSSASTCSTAPRPGSIELAKARRRRADPGRARRSPTATTPTTATSGSRRPSRSLAEVTGAIDARRRPASLLAAAEKLARADAR